MAFISKARKAANNKYNFSKDLFTPSDAIKKAKEISTEKFDTTFRVSFNLNVDPRHADQMIRGSVILPNGSGKIKKVLAIVEDDKVKEAKEAGADFAGGESMITKIKQENWFDFDIIVTTPSMMPKLGKLGKTLGPKGLMPNPKLGTITTNIKKIVTDIKKGQIEYRVDKDGNMNLIFGKKSFDDKKLLENFNTLLDCVKKAKPASTKGTYIRNLAISTTMGPGFKILLEK